MNLKIKFAILAHSILFILAGCGGGNEDSISALQGDWKGVFRDSGGTFRSLKTTIDSSGTITKLQVFNQAALTGSISKTGDKTYSFSLSDGTEGGFLADDSGNHMGFLTDSYEYGVLEKGATMKYSNSNNFGRGHYVGNWSGYSVEINSNLDVVDQYTSSATVPDQSLDLSGNDSSGSFSGNITYQDNSKGYAYGTYINSLGSSGNLMVLLSPDKTFAASWACDYSGSSTLVINNVNYCSFAMWVKQ